MKKTLYLLIVIISFFSISSCSLYEEVEMLGVQSYNFESVPGSQVKAEIIFKINNPNFYSITMKKSDFKVFLDDKEIGTAGMEDDLKNFKENGRRLYTWTFNSGERHTKLFDAIIKKSIV